MKEVVSRKMQILARSEENVYVFVCDIIFVIILLWCSTIQSFFSYTMVFQTVV